MASGGGGSVSGTTDYPAYMKTFHGRLLNTDGAESPVISIMGAFNYAASGDSPYLVYCINYEPIHQAFFGLGKTVNSYAKIFELLESYQNLNLQTLYNSFVNDTDVAAITADVSLTLDDDISINILPKFKGNLRSVGAVMASAYAIGETLIWDSKLKALAKERLAIEQLKNQNKDFALRMAISVMEANKSVVTLTTDIVKYYYGLKTELEDHYSSMNAKELKWDLDLMQYCNNTLSSISGAALSQGITDKAPSKVASALGGALSGAAMGAQMSPGNPGYGAAIGGVLGLAGGLA